MMLSNSLIMMSIWTKIPVIIIKISAIIKQPWYGMQVAYSIQCSVAKLGSGLRGNDGEQASGI